MPTQMRAGEHGGERHDRQRRSIGGHVPSIGIATAAASEAAEHQRALAADHDEADAGRDARPRAR